MCEVACLAGIVLSLPGIARSECRQAEIGLAVFRAMRESYLYRVNHVGARWSAYWWSRLGALLLKVGIGLNSL